MICRTAVLLGKGDGTFGTPIPHSLAIGGSLLVAADFNHDGIEDILDLQPSNALAVALGHGDGTFAAEVTAVAAAPQFQFGVTGDFNGDEIPDLAGICKQAGSFCVLPGKGDGTFGPGIISRRFDRSASGGSGFQQRRADRSQATAPCWREMVMEPFGPPYLFSRGSVPSWTSTGTATRTLSNCREQRCGRKFHPAVCPDQRQSRRWLLYGRSIFRSWTWPIASGSLTSAFGVNLAQQTASASALDDTLPTTLGGIRVHIRDSNERFSSPPHLRFEHPDQLRHDVARTSRGLVSTRLAQPTSPKASGWLRSQQR